MRNILFSTILILSTVFISIEAFAITDQDIEEITERLENYSTDELIERRQSLLVMLNEDSSDNSENTKILLFELSLIEQLLILAGIVIADNVTEDSSIPPDTVFPIITILGDNPAIVELGSTYEDVGATSNEGTISVISNNVDTNVIGTYSVVYSATDAAGNTSTATRTVNVVDTTPPVVVLNGSAEVTVELGDTYTELGATATDADGNFGTDGIVITGSVDTSSVGIYELTYSATDLSGNEGSITRTVSVVDTTPPVFTSSATFSAVENQTAIGTVTATDLQTVTFTISGTELQITSGGVLTFAVAPDYETKTTYTATVTATDASLNNSSQDITVNVTNDEDDDDTGTGTGTGGTGTGTGGTGTGTGT